MVGRDGTALLTRVNGAIIPRFSNVGSAGRLNKVENNGFR